MFGFSAMNQYDGEHEKLSNSNALAIEFSCALRNTGIVREHAHEDTYNGWSAFSAFASDMLVSKAMIRNHPSAMHIRDTIHLTDQEKEELDG
jgi:hypothetical protein